MATGPGLDAALEAHYRTVVKGILDGRVIPLLGAGVNLCDRPPHAAWARGRYLPSGNELAAEEFDYPANEERDLIQVSQAR